MFDLEPAIAAWRQKMLAAGIETPIPLDELELHLREDIERQRAAGVGEQEAFAMAIQRIGEAGALKTEFRNAGTMKWLNGHRIYDVVLALYALNTAFSTRMMIDQSWMANGTIIGFWVELANRSWLGLVNPAYLPYLGLEILLGEVAAPNSVIPWLIRLNFIYLVAMVATLFARCYRPKMGSLLTRLLNWALLPILPLGTLIGLYGLWRAKLAQPNETDKSWLGKMIAFTMAPATNPSTNMAGRLLAATWRIMCGWLAGLCGGVTLLLALFKFAAANGFGPPRALHIWLQPYDGVDWMLFGGLIIDVVRMVLGAWLLWCAWQMIRGAWTQPKTARSVV